MVSLKSLTSQSTHTWKHETRHEVQCTQNIISKTYDLRARKKLDAKKLKMNLLHEIEVELKILKIRAIFNLHLPARTSVHLI